MRGSVPGGPGTDNMSMAEDLFRPHPEVVSQRLGETGVLVDLRTGGIFELNSTGVRVWELLGSGTSRAEVVRRLSEEFGASRAVVQGDVDDLMTRLLEARLLEPDGTS